MLRIPARGRTPGKRLRGVREMIRHPNRQALHDKIAGTVVTRV